MLSILFKVTSDRSRICNLGGLAPDMTHTHCAGASQTGSEGTTSLTEGQGEAQCCPQQTCKYLVTGDKFIYTLPGRIQFT